MLNLEIKDLIWTEVKTNISQNYNWKLNRGYYHFTHYKINHQREHSKCTFFVLFYFHCSPFSSSQFKLAWFYHFYQCCSCIGAFKWGKSFKQQTKNLPERKFDDTSSTFIYVRNEFHRRNYETLGLRASLDRSL